MTEEIQISPQNPEAARAEIERTRARMSETINEIEDVLLRKKERLQDRFDIGARIREKPLHAAGFVFGAGVLLGFLTGGGETGGGRLEAPDRAALWEARARRLLSIAREQEEDIEELQATVEELSMNGRQLAGPPDEAYVDSGSRFGFLKEAIRERVGELLADAGSALIEGIRRRV